MTLNMPNTEDIKVAVMYLDKTGNNHKGALINPGQIQALKQQSRIIQIRLRLNYDGGSIPRQGNSLL